jgi:hypothetical protein
VDLGVNPTLASLLPRKSSLCSRSGAAALSDGLDVLRRVRHEVPQARYVGRFNCELAYALASSRFQHLVRYLPRIESHVSSSLVVTGPGPQRNLTQWMKLILGLRVRVLHRDLRAEFNVRSDGVTEPFIVGKARCV